ncbi:MAG TPA: ABC transporter ATP-binding protein [Patescibacteria group bacterium]|nr:ABC transporter ATP-binding protein [Patescibacteria group bacterium]
MDDAAVTLEHVSVKLGGTVAALDDVCAQLPKGKIIGFIGPSGAGKTTLIRSIVGRQHLDRGAITIFGLPAGTKPLRAQTGYMTQEVSIYPDLTVAENLHYFAVMMRVPRAKITKQVHELIKTVDMLPQANQVGASLSGGQKQRLSLAIALVGAPRLLALDEPTVGLDPVLREELWALFRTLADGGTTLIISSHVMEEAERCDQLLLVRGGKLLANASPAELRKQTNTHSVEQSFLKLVRGQV